MHSNSIPSPLSRNLSAAGVAITTGSLLGFLNLIELIQENLQRAQDQREAVGFVAEG